MQVDANPHNTSSENKITISFHTNARLGGDYLTEVILTFDEIDTLYAASLKQRNYAEAVKELAQSL